MTAVPSIDDPALFLNMMLGQSSPDLARLTLIPSTTDQEEPAALPA